MQPDYDGISTVKSNAPPRSVLSSEYRAVLHLCIFTEFYGKGLGLVGVCGT